MKTFVFFIGGTGARVLRSLTMLLASGVTLKNEGDSIVPIIVDYDATNADLKKAGDLLGAYNTLHATCGYTDDHFEGGFFRVPLGIEENGRFKEFDSLVKMSFGDDKNTFGKYIGYDTLGDITRQTKVTKMLVDTLYDTSPDNSRDRELNLELKYGFKGNPNIGSVVFNEYFKTDQFREQFKDNFNPGDRIFIVASIFGGTGSSGLPQLVKKIREKVTNALQDDGSVKAIRESVLGACIVLPYFKVKDRPESAVNSLTFNSKAKAALGYYHDEINDEMSEVYYIGCNEQNVGYDNVEGGEKQENKAHLVELLSAMSIVEFATHDSQGDQATKFFEYTTTAATGNLANPSFLDVISRPNGGKMYQYYEKKMNAFAMMVKYFQQYTRREGGKLKIMRSSYYKNLEDYLAPGKDFSEKLNSFCERFVAWVDEMNDNSILRFYPYNFKAKELYELIKIDDSNKYKKQSFDSEITRSLNNETAHENRKDSDGGKTFLRHVFTACMGAVSNID